MKIAYYEQLGSAADVLKIGETEKPKPAPNEVLVKIFVSGLNPTDLKTRIGFSAAMPFPKIIPHQDGAGIIEEVGENVSKDRIGERVWIYEAQSGRANGTAAEFVTVPSKNAVNLPDHVSFEIGASLGIPALTAHRCLFADGDLQGRKVLVHGGAGAVGNASILLAKANGAWVAATVSNDAQASLAKAAGADLVVNRFDDQKLQILEQALSGDGFSRIIDVDVASNLDLNIATLAQGGVISSYASLTADATVSLPLLKAMKGGCVFRFVLIYTVPDEEKLQSITALNKVLASGSYNPPIAKIFELDNIVEAHEALESGKLSGKILLKVQ